MWSGALGRVVVTYDLHGSKLHFSCRFRVDTYRICPTHVIVPRFYQICPAFFGV